MDANVEIQVCDASSGKLKRPVIRVENRVLPAGIRATANLLIGNGYAPHYIALGTDSTEVSDKDIWLGTEVFRNAITRRGEEYCKARFQLYVLATQVNGYTINEIGLYLPPTTSEYAYEYPRLYTEEVAGITPLSVGTLFARAIVPAIVKTASDTVTITWDIPIGNKISPPW